MTSIALMMIDVIDALHIVVTLHIVAALQIMVDAQ